MAADHRELDDVRRGALDDRVDRQPLAQAPALALVGAELRNPAAPAEKRLDEPFVGCVGDRLVDEAADGREALEIALDVLASLHARDSKPVGQAEIGQPVGDAVVHHLRLRALRRRDRVGVGADDPGRGCRVDILARREDLTQDVF